MNNYFRISKKYILLCFIFFVILHLEYISNAKDINWQQEEDIQLRMMRSHLSDDTKIRLSVSCVDSYDGKTIFLGGSYREPAASYRSVLLVSHDSGKSWQDSGVWLAASDICYIYCFDSEIAWVMTCWSCEGSQAPFYLFKTTDGGQTWERSHSDLTPDILTSLSWPTDFSFNNPKNGIITFRSMDGDICTYKTLDGGIEWELLTKKKVTLTIDNENKFAGAPHDLFSKLNTKYKVDTIWPEGIIILSVLKRSQKSWAEISRLPYIYRLKGVTVIPEKQKSQQKNSTDAKKTPAD